MTYYPFWHLEKKKVIIGKTKLCNFLMDMGFGNYTKSTMRTANTFIIRIIDGYVQFHNAKTVKRFLLDHVSNDQDLVNSELEREKVLDELIGLNPRTLEVYLSSLITY